MTKSEILNNVALTESRSNIPIIFKRLGQSDVNLLNYYVHKNLSISSSDTNKVLSSDQTSLLTYHSDYLYKYIQDTDISLTAYDHLFVINIFKRYYGDFINSITAFDVDSASMSSNASYYLNGNSRFYYISFDSSSYLGIGDMYCGVIYIFSTASSITSFNIDYQSAQLRKELIITCQIGSDEFNYSTNPTAFTSTAQTDYTDKISYPEELLKNGDIEDGSTTYWNSNYCSISAYAKNNSLDNQAINKYIYSGTHSLQVTYSNTSTTSSDVYQDIDLTAYGLQIYDSIRAEWLVHRGTMTADQILTFSIDQYNGSSFSSTTSKDISITSLPSDEWYRVILYDKLQYDQQLRLRMTIDSNPKDGKYLFIDMMSLKERSSSLGKNKVFITSIGLYNNKNELVGLAKLNKPLKKSTYPLHFTIRMDIL